MSITKPSLERSRVNKIDSDCTFWNTNRTGPGYTLLLMSSNESTATRSNAEGDKSDIARP